MNSRTPRDPDAKYTLRWRLEEPRARLGDADPGRAGGAAGREQAERSLSAARDKPSLLSLFWNFATAAHIPSGR